MYKRVSTQSPGSENKVEILCANKVNLEDVLFYKFDECKSSDKFHKKEDNKCNLTKECIATLSNISTKPEDKIFHKKCLIDSDCNPNQKCQELKEEINNNFKSGESYCVNIYDNCKYGDCVISDMNFEKMNTCEFIEGTTIDNTPTQEPIDVNGNYCTNNKYYIPSKSEKNNNECFFYNYSLISYKNNELLCMQTCNTSYDCNDKCIKNKDETFGECQIEHDDSQTKKKCRSDVDCKGITNRKLSRDNVVNVGVSIDECSTEDGFCKIRLENINCKDSDRKCGTNCPDCSKNNIKSTCNEHDTCRWNFLESNVDDSCESYQYLDGDKCKCSKKECNNSDDCKIFVDEPSFINKPSIKVDISDNYDHKFDNDGNILYKKKDPLDKDYSYKKGVNVNCKEGFIEQKNECKSNVCNGTYYQSCNTDDDCTRCHKIGKCILPGECKLKKYEYSFFFGNCKFNNSEECSTDIMCNYTGPICVDRNHDICSQKKLKMNVVVPEKMLKALQSQIAVMKIIIVLIKLMYVAGIKNILESVYQQLVILMMKKYVINLNMLTIAT